MNQDANAILQQIASRYGNRLYWHIRRLVVSHDDTEDALQETFIKVFTRSGSFKGDDSSLEAWCYRIATNEALEHLRVTPHAGFHFAAVHAAMAGDVHKYLDGKPARGGKGHSTEVWLYEVQGGTHSWADKEMDTYAQIWAFMSHLMY